MKWAVVRSERHIKWCTIICVVYATHQSAGGMFNNTPCIILERMGFMTVSTITLHNLVFDVYKHLAKIHTLGKWIGWASEAVRRRKQLCQF
ncbi:hypothetical protein EDD22DRAFT_856517 [Suillus occidentalis]|nr:hypothetical protein EDD22DRAFT_856517 [Suillus occidentalis]